MTNEAAQQAVPEAGGAAARVERDSMGEIAVPGWALWGAQTQRAVENFPISGVRLERSLIRALGLIKAQAALVNLELGAGGLTPPVAEAIAAAAGEVAEGRHDDHFPVDVFQTGSGTSSNMNANEVIARLAARRSGAAVHPNDHVNASQSSNDVFPSAIRIAACDLITHALLPALDELHAALAAKAVEFADVVKAGRTHLMDAVPVTLGQEFGAYAAQIDEAKARLLDGLARLARLPLGGTAVGTGLNAPAEFGLRVVERLAILTGLPLTPAPNRFAAQAAHDALAETSGHLRTLAVALVKIANDLRWMASGPNTGLAELALPDLAPGSSIMPAKVNPVIPEAVTQTAAQVIGNDAVVAFAASQGAFELNAYLPVMARNLLESIRILGAAASVFARRCVSGVTADVARCRAYAEASPAVVTALAPLIGYDAAASLAKSAAATGRSLREAALERGGIDPGALDAALDVAALARPPT